MTEEALVASGKRLRVDQKFNTSVDGGKYENCLFTRLVAKNKKFTKVSTLVPEDYAPSLLAGITCVRLILVGFALSIIIKRFNRR